MEFEVVKDAESEFISGAREYVLRLTSAISEDVLENAGLLAAELLRVWRDRNRVFICGNGGSAANAIHIANDLHYGIGSCGTGEDLRGIDVEAFTANSSILTCLANDIGYEEIFAHQLSVKAKHGDLLVILSGSGNSKNVVNALKKAKEMEIKSVAVLAYDGGKCKEVADIVIHSDVHDMQIAEDMQLLVGHMCMQHLSGMKDSVGVK